jgi:hypothetical protein
MWPNRTFDVFMVNDEFDLVETRLELLNKHVDTFLIGESDTTFSGRKKEPKFAHLASEKVIHILIEIPEELVNEAKTGSLLSRWGVEEFQRDYLENKAREASTESDLVFFTDVDEIPSSEQISEVVRTLKLNKDLETLSLLMPVSFRRLNWLLQGSERWNKGKAFRGGGSGVGGIRYTEAATTTSFGCHLSYVGFDHKKIATKYEDFSHKELDNEHAKSSLLLEFCDIYGISHTGGFYQAGNGFLIQLNENQISSQLRAVKALRPKWFDESPFVGSKSQRLAASLRVTRILKGQSQLNFEQPKLSEIVFASCLAIVHEMKRRALPLVLALGKVLEHFPIVGNLVALRRARLRNLT